MKEKIRKILGLAVSVSMAVSAVLPWTGVTAFAAESGDGPVISQLPAETTPPTETGDDPVISQLPAGPENNLGPAQLPAELPEDTEPEPETTVIDIPERVPPEETCDVDYKESSLDAEDYVVETVVSGEEYNVKITIPPDAPEGDLVINLSDVILKEFEKFYQMPGGEYLFRVTIVNQSGRPYQYKDGSFVLATAKASKFGEQSYYLGYDGQRIPVRFISNVYVELDPIKELFGVSKGEQISLEDMFQLYDRLEEKGFTGETAFTDYMLNWFNEDFGTNYETWDDLTHDKTSKLQQIYGKPGINSIWSASSEGLAALMEKYPDSIMASNLHLTEKADGIYDVQFYWPEDDLASFMYDVFYQDILSIAYGEEVDQMDPSSKGNAFTKTRGVGDYMPETDLYAQTNAYFAGLTNEAMGSETGASFDMIVCLDGPDMGNTYQYYEASFYNVIELEQTSTTYTVTHEYYTSTDGGAYQLDGTVTEEAVAGTVGDAIAVADIQKLTDYNGNSYSYASSQPEEELVLSEDVSQNVITLIYQREVTTEEPEEPEEPDTDPPYVPVQPDPDPDEEIDEPETPLEPGPGEDAVPGGPSEAAEEPVEEPIDDEDAPKTDAPPQTGRKVAGSLALLAGAAVTAFITFRKKEK